MAQNSFPGQRPPDWQPPEGTARKGGGCLKAILISFAVLAGLAVLGSIAGSNDATKPDGAADPSSSPATGAEQASGAEPASMKAAGPASTNWSYSSKEDKVRAATTYYASTTSTNSIHQNFPYDPETTMDLVVRKSPSSGTDVIFTVSSGQLMCPSYEGCRGTVRFDNGAPQRVRFLGPEDNSSDTIFVSGAKEFVARLKRSKHLVLEKTMYEAGAPQFEFDVSGLDWEH